MNPFDRTSRRGRHEHEHCGGRNRQRVSIGDHERFREALSPARQCSDEIDELVSDPLVERHATRRREHETARMLRLLDELQPGGSYG